MSIERRNRVFWVVAGLVVVALIAGGAYAVTRGDDDGGGDAPTASQTDDSGTSADAGDDGDDGDGGSGEADGPDGGDGDSTEVDGEADGDGPAADPEADETTVDYLDGVNDLLADPVENPDADSVSADATGSALEEALAQAQEFHENGWSQEGAPKVVWVRKDADRSTATEMALRVCLDSSAVKVVDSAGNDVRGDAPDRSVNLYLLTKVEGKWLVKEHSFPDDADC